VKELWNIMETWQRALVIKCILSGPKVSLARGCALKKHKIQEWAWDDLPKNVKYQAERIFNVALMLNWKAGTAYK
jgi:hypothetical protein